MTSTVIVQRTDELGAEEIEAVETAEMTPDPDDAPLAPSSDPRDARATFSR